MKILAIEFSSEHRSIAVLDGERLLAEQIVTEGRGTRALSLIESTLDHSELGKLQIDCIAVGVGPGSYTGIRSAIALTQGWQLALGVKVLGINSLEAMAKGEQAAGRRGEITLLVGAQIGLESESQWEHVGDAVLRAAGKGGGGLLVCLSALSSLCLGPCSFGFLLMAACWI